jgi:hypothetical protein
MNYLTGHNKHLSDVLSTSFVDELRTVQLVITTAYMFLCLPILFIRIVSLGSLVRWAATFCLSPSNRGN